MTITTGVYLLTSDVINPNPDRRQKFDWRRWVKVPSGTRFQVMEVPPWDTRDPATPSLKMINLEISHASLYDVRDHHELWGLLAPHLERQTETIRDHFRLIRDKHSVDTDEMLERLCQLGIVNVEVLYSVAEVIDREQREEYERKHPTAE
jgi:hypothetical protein